jgi:hypothetical protein
MKASKTLLLLLVSLFWQMHAFAQDTGGESAGESVSDSVDDQTTTDDVSEEDVATTTTMPRPAPRKSAVEEVTGKPVYDFISDGQRLEVEDKGFSIIAPRGWEVYTKQANLSLLMQVPFEKGMKYQRTIQVAAFSGPRFMDEVTAKEYEGIIVRKFSQASILISEFRVRNHMAIDMADGRPGILFYSEFSIEGVDLMQAHVLVSAPEKHYLLTYTDLAGHFEDEQANQYLTEAWESIISVQLSGPTPGRFQTVAAFGAIALGLVLLAIAVWFIRSWQAGRQYRDYSNRRDLEDGENAVTGDSVTLEPVSREASLAPESNFSGAGVSFMDDMRLKNTAKTPKAVSKAGKEASHDAPSRYNSTIEDADLREDDDELAV